MHVARSRRHLHAPLLKDAPLLHAAQAPPRLTSVEIRRTVVGIDPPEFIELAHRSLQVSRVAQFHRQSVACKTIGGLLLHHALEDFESRSHACATIPPKCPALTSTLPNREAA